MATKKKDATTEELLAGMLSDYQSRGGYVPKTTAENQARAENEYKSYYDQLRLGAQQQQERADLALRQQREGLQDTYDRQREASAKEYRQRLSQADRHMLSRGMQRSSYGAQIRANIGQQGAEAQQRLWDAQGAAEGNIDAQRAQLAQQLGAQLQQYDAARAADVLKRTTELDEQEYERQQAEQERRDRTGMQLASMLRQAERDQISDEQFEKQFGLSKQQAEAQLANMRWQQQYQEGRAKASDAQWQQNYDLNREKLAADLAAQQWQQRYQEGRAKTSDEQWAKQFGLSEQQLAAQLANQKWQQDYQTARDKVADAQWQQNYDLTAQKWADTLAEQMYQRQYQEARDAVKDSQWDKEFQYKVNPDSFLNYGVSASADGISPHEYMLEQGLELPQGRSNFFRNVYSKRAVSSSNNGSSSNYGSSSYYNSQQTKKSTNKSAATAAPGSGSNSTAGLINTLNNVQNGTGTYQPLIDFMKKYEKDNYRNSSKG